MNQPGRTLLTLALAGAALLAAAPVSAHEGHHHTAMGTVKTVDGAKLDLETKAGELTFALTETTSYKRADAAATREDVAAGERAVVMYETKDGRNLAIEVKLGAKKGEGQAAARSGRSDAHGRR